MMWKENESQKEGSLSFARTSGAFTGLISKAKLWAKLAISKKARHRFVESHLDRTLANQIRALRGNLTQAEFAKKIGIEHANNVSARLENPQYGKHQIRILKQIAAACDVALVVWFVPFSRLVDWATATPFIDKGLVSSFYNLPSFEEEERGVSEAIGLGQAEEGNNQVVDKPQSARSANAESSTLGEKIQPGIDRGHDFGSLQAMA